ncbi:HTH-type transcriptional regulator NmtR [bacterium BMS3Abin02]|nr:HTH-type transcriptional regulator NmtR [bacterium BMS3Abin02]GBE22936.1 HTH-type transcriptional regulator NmtR [bacterium BMS3Bbin01]HDH24569.1 transcriptional regulator [Actinomycetota bacterium]HDK44710.1 transcriptional regulator [Actinomycetota bacterium]
MEVQIVCDPTKPALRDRPLIDSGQAERIMKLFKMLGNAGRLRVVHALERAGELYLSDLARQVGMTPQALSNQLTRLVDQGIVTSRRAGNNVFYRIADPCVTSLLDLAICLSEEAGVAASTTERVS